MDIQSTIPGETIRAIMQDAGPIMEQYPSITECVVTLNDIDTVFSTKIEKAVTHLRENEKQIEDSMVKIEKMRKIIPVLNEDLITLEDMVACLENNLADKTKNKQQNNSIFSLFNANIGAMSIVDKKSIKEYQPETTRKKNDGRDQGDQKQSSKKEFENYIAPKPATLFDVAEKHLETIHDANYLKAL